MEIGILADSHIQKELIARNDPAYQHLLKKLSSIFSGVAYIFHAGDVICPEFISDLEHIAPVEVVLGNSDVENDIYHWPKAIAKEVQNISIGMTHRPEHFDLFKPKSIRVFISGHTHIPSIQESLQGVLMINPGSACFPRPLPPKKNFPQSPQPRPTVALLTIEQDLITAFIKIL
jgi:putative phosphoesterase